jgi:hypothetical protein
MNQTQYGIIRAESQFPVRELLAVPHGDNDLIVGYPAFGPNFYIQNLEAMSRDYSHPETGERISFRPAASHESISAAAYGFGDEGEFDAKRDIFDPRWFQLGYIVRTQDGVFTNTQVTDEVSLKKLLEKAEKVNGICLIDDNIAFAPYETFQRGGQDCDTFVHGGLARALDHTSEKVASNIRKIASHRNYNGVNVWGFDDVKEPVLRVAGLDSYRGGDRLDVDGYDGDVNGNGCAFGVRTQKISAENK